jgi:IS5 family transposase
MVWVTAFVHLGTGLLWSWRLGPGNADERQHLLQLLHTLPARALIIADAAYMGYELA